MEGLVISNITVWQALSLLCMSGGGVPLSEERSRNALRQVGMKRHEMDEPYPESKIEELLYLIEHPDYLEKSARKASEWMIKRN
jgi:hypothetical protein